MDDDRFGRPYLLMPLVDGRHTGDVPALCDWLTALSTERQRALHASFLDVLATIHRITDPPPVAPRVDLDWWERYVDWAFGPDGEPLHELLRRCEAAAPAATVPPSLLWGDVRLGNVVFGDDLRPVAVLDWEMASIGPAESDLAWFTALSALTDRFVGERVPGFLDRDEIVEHHEAALGRRMHDLDWHEAVALVRAAAVGIRTQLVAAARAGRPTPSVVGHPLVECAAEAVSAVSGAGRAGDRR